MTVYMGFRIAGIVHVYAWDAATPARPVRLATRNDLWDHSPTGFEWGYQGSGPAQLALALAADALGNDERAVEIHQALKRRLVAGLSRHCWSITKAGVLGIIQNIEAERGDNIPCEESITKQQERGDQ